MKSVALSLLLLAAIPFKAHTRPQNISTAQLQAVLDLPLGQAIQRRATYKGPLTTAYTRQIAVEGKDCQAEAAENTQAYNVCMGKATEQVDNDYAIFYNNVQMLCHDQAELKALQSSEASWSTYRDSATKAASTSWPDGTGAPGFYDQVYLSLVRDHMKELHEIYGLNIAQ